VSAVSAASAVQALTWVYGEDRTLNDGRVVVCLRSGDIPKLVDGSSVCPWYKLGVDNGGKEYEAQCRGSGAFTTYPTDPADRVNVRVLVFWSDAARLGLVGVARHQARVPQVAPKGLKEWPHDCPRCKRRECAIQLAVTWDCKYGCWK
jgi:hypothetical protein